MPFFRSDNTPCHVHTATHGPGARNYLSVHDLRLAEYLWQHSMYYAQAPPFLEAPYTWHSWQCLCQLSLTSGVVVVVAAGCQSQAGRPACSQQEVVAAAAEAVRLGLRSHQTPPTSSSAAAASWPWIHMMGLSDAPPERHACMHACQDQRKPAEPLADDA